MSRTTKKPSPKCDWCGHKVRIGRAIHLGGKVWCSTACGPTSAHGARTRGPGKWRRP